MVYTPLKIIRLYWFSPHLAAIYSWPCSFIQKNFQILFLGGMRYRELPYSIKKANRTMNLPTGSLPDTCRVPIRRGGRWLKIKMEQYGWAHKMKLFFV